MAKPWRNGSAEHVLQDNSGSRAEGPTTLIMPPEGKEESWQAQIDPHKTAQKLGPNSTVGSMVFPPFGIAPKWP